MDFVADYPALVGGLVALAVAAAAWAGDHRRRTRRDPDRVGFMPWTGMFFWALLFAAVLLAAGVQQLMGRG